MLPSMLLANFCLIPRNKVDFWNFGAIYFRAQKSGQIRHFEPTVHYAVYLHPRVFHPR